MVFALLFLALVALALALLTAVPAPVAVPWKIALLVGEFGYALALAPAFLALAAVDLRAGFPGLATVIFGASGCAVCLFLKPLFQAGRIGLKLPAQLTRAFGPARSAHMGRKPFELRNLFHFPAAAVPAQTHAFAPGLVLDFYPAAGRAAGDSAPCVIVVHGGGWDTGDCKQLPGFNHWLARSGYAVAAISYRLAPTHPWPAQRDDVLGSIAWLKANALQLGLDPMRLVLLGRSAGGQIATAVGYLGDPAIRGVVALYAPQDMRFTWSVSREDDALNSLQLMRQYLGGPPEGREALYDSASGQALVRRGVTPPTLLLHGTIDTLSWVKHSQRLAARLAEEAVPHVFVELPWATHGFDVNLAGPGGQLTSYALEWFLAEVTK